MPHIIEVKNMSPTVFELDPEAPIQILPGGRARILGKIKAGHSTMSITFTKAEVKVLAEAFAQALAPTG
jgi:hypothetical protein